MVAKKQITVQGIEISIFQQNNADYISLTGIALYKDKERTDYIIQNWLKNRSTIDFVGLWEVLHNPHFNSIEFDGIKIYLARTASLLHLKGGLKLLMQLD